MSSRAGIVVTGTEVLTGRITDRNGPWLADRLLELGVELAHITICGDRPDDIEAQLAFLAGQGVDLIVTTGGLGPTADDLTVETVARFCGRNTVLDNDLEQRIAEILRGLTSRMPDFDFSAVLAANRKQAIIPEGATVLDPVGTAPGVVVTPAAGQRKPTVVVLPGPPRELQAMWPAALATDEVAAAIAGRTVYRQETIRMFGPAESALAESLRQAQQDLPGYDALEITTCLRRGELEIVTRYRADDAPAYQRLRNHLRERFGAAVYSTDGSTVDDQVAALLTGHWAATAESCTGGLVAARLTDRPGSSDYLAGGVVSYSNAAKSELLGVDPALIETHGAVSEHVAEAMARGAQRRFGADVAVSTTGVAGPGGGSPEKPVGTVCFCVAVGDAPPALRTVRLPGDRADVRDFSTTIAMHMLRRALS
ncbi:competence/damage-inducible protein A [Mycolicibacterium brumae]|uniref:CinA-like protein n=1 Tax=Mycolicibacterium brumae TaxID=85968 RepID=A0A2G5PDW6_9MYCO|nr:competence/damage-inducible protein A [Mycolicibacterium brumae]MCV7192822.1 competence/damage-inducible protein A [Mycolicibacterium brumae]PIB76507.1 competence/damage-inducible protein A [Mycolicibacterium brumae]RWA23410.1 hypothetical protein MBRU_00905 [Mycolicibacterium brumae DSM 44177]UWW08658.1 competence/damage-inducible protein A [Mycolicibacterium brumae]